MDYRPTVDWRSARRIAAATAGPPPATGRADLARLVADLRVNAGRAGGIAARHLGVTGSGAREIRVVDRAGWVRAAGNMAESSMDQLGLAARPPGRMTRVRGTANGVLAGAVLGLASRRMLGQYDAFTGDDALYLVAPSILEHERRHGFVPADFRLWVALHEQTHAVQVRLAPWLTGYLRTLMERLADDDAGLVEGLLGWRASRDASALLASRAGMKDLGRLSAAMTFLEGHADHVADTAGRRHIRTVAALRRAFRRPEHTAAARLSRTLDKGAQYRDGLAFCRAVTAARGRDALGAAFAGPAALPTAAEITDPPSWIARVHG